jgi:hypothetical protein
MIKKNSLILIICILLLVLSSFVTAKVAADDMKAFWDQNWNDWHSRNLFEVATFDFSLHGSTELNWYPVSDWERTTCSKEFTTDFNYGTETSRIKIDGRVYDLTVTVNAKINNTEFTDENGRPQFLLSVGWYIQGLPQGGNSDNEVEYKIRLLPGSDYLNLGEGDTEKEFNIVEGEADFYSEYTIKLYNTLKLYVDNNEFEFDVVDMTNDS